MIGRWSIVLVTALEAAVVLFGITRAAADDLWVEPPPSGPRDG